jgi:SAM-dependent methyltransferase
VGPIDRWTAADAYDRYMGRWSRQVAAAFLDWLAIRRGADWIDVGCGTGALSASIVEWYAPRTLVGVDPSADFVHAASERVRRPGVRFMVGSAGVLPVPDQSADVVVSGLALNFFADPADACREAGRVAYGGGVVAAYLWDYATGMGLLRAFWDSAVALDPTAAELDEAVRFPIAGPEPLTRLWAEAGLADVEVRPIDVPTVFRDFDDYWAPFLTGVGPAPGYATALDPERRERLRERLRTTLPVEPDGTIHLTARAWAVRGRA